MRNILLRQRQFWQKMHVQPERLYIYYLRFALGIIMVIVVTEKHPKQLFYSSKIPFFGRWI